MNMDRAPPDARTSYAPSLRILIQSILGVLFIALIVRYGIVFFEQRSGIDDLYSVILIGSPDFMALWRAITLGIDGNPPEYLNIGSLISSLTGR
jgi:hypothetical protein